MRWCPTGLIALMLHQSRWTMFLLFLTQGQSNLFSCSQSKLLNVKMSWKSMIWCLQLSHKPGLLVADHYFESDDWNKFKKKKAVTFSQSQAQIYFWITRSASNVFNSCVFFWLSNVCHQASASFNCTQTNYYAGTHRYHQSASFIKWLTKPSHHRSWPSAVICICLPS